MSLPWDAPLNSFKFTNLATPLQKGQVGVWTVAAFAYALQIPLSISAFISLRGHRLPIAFLLTGVVLSFLGSLAFIAVNVFSVTIPFAATSAAARDLIAATTIFSLFNYWAAILLFVAIIHVLLDRQHAFHSFLKSPPRKYSLAYYIIFWIWVLVMFGLGTAAGALIGAITEESLGIFLPTAKGFFNDSFKIYNNLIAYNDIYISSNSVLIATVVIVCGCTGYAYFLMCRGQIQCMVTRKMIFAVMPVYVLYTIVNLAFTVIFISSYHAIDATNFAWSLLYNLFYITLTSILLALGMNPNIWASNLESTATVKKEKSNEDASTHPGSIVPAVQQQLQQPLPGPGPESILLAQGPDQPSASISPASPMAESSQQPPANTEPEITNKMESH